MILLLLLLLLLFNRPHLCPDTSQNSHTFDKSADFSEDLIDFSENPCYQTSQTLFYVQPKVPQASDAFSQTPYNPQLGSKELTQNCDSLNHADSNAPVDYEKPVFSHNTSLQPMPLQLNHQAPTFSPPMMQTAATNTDPVTFNASGYKKISPI